MLFYFLMKSAELCTIEKYHQSTDVGTLKELICSQHNIQEDNIILIANGGFCLQDGVFSTYNCGDHENNPVFVFLRQNKRLLQEVASESSLDREFHRHILRLEVVIKKSGSTLSVLRENESISSEVLDSSKRISREIEIAIRDQFLLVEGWNAAVANLCDSLQSIEKRISAMKDNISRFKSRELEEGFEMMTKFERRKLELEKIPLLRSLLSDEDKEGGQRELPSNLLQWVLDQDRGTSEHVTVQSIVTEAHEAYLALLGLASDSPMTVVEGLSSWGKNGMIADVMKTVLDGEELVRKCRPVQQQCQGDGDEERSLETAGDHYTSNRAYMERLNHLAGVRAASSRLMDQIECHQEYMASTVKQCQDIAGSSILHDHCVNSRVQLDNLHRLYSHLSGLLRKVVGSKADLVRNIDERKSWLMKYETNICKIDENLFVAKEKMKRVRAGCKVLEQMGSAPRIYAQGILEIRRRQQLIDMWYSWGTLCSRQSRDLRQKDRELRQRIDGDLENHFMQTLFSSLHTFSLPKIGDHLLNSSPPVLPQISQADIETISSKTPSLIEFLQIPRISLDNSHMITKSEPNHKVAVDICQQGSQDTHYMPPSESCPPLEYVSLMPVPEDTRVQFQELLLSVNGLQLDHQLKHAVAEVQYIDGASGRMAESIDSMEFQLTNDKTTETGRDLVCVSRAMLDCLLLYSRELREILNAVTWQCLQQVEEQKKMVTEVANLLNRNAGAQSNTEPAVRGADSVCMKHRQFSGGDAVCFTGQLIHGSLQWRMLTSDHRVYFLHDSCMRAASTVGEGSDGVQSDLSPGPHRRSSPPLSLVWGSFLSKEEYISRKTSNRYGLPVNTKFFRVQADVNWPLLSNDIES